MNTVGDTQRQDDDRGGKRDRIELDTGITGETQRGRGRQSDYDQRADRAGQASEHQDHKDHEHHEHAGQQRHGVGLPRFRKGVVEHRDAGYGHPHVRVSRVQPPLQVSRVTDCRGDLGETRLRILERHVEPGCTRVERDQIPRQQRFGERDLAYALEFIGAQRETVPHQVLDGQVIAVSPRMLEIRDRVDSNGIGNLPGFCGQPLEGVRVWISLGAGLPGQ